MPFKEKTHGSVLTVEPVADAGPLRVKFERDVSMEGVKATPRQGYS